jgi:hypothetical protein
MTCEVYPIRASHCIWTILSGSFNWVIMYLETSAHRAVYGCLSIATSSGLALGGPLPR